MASEIIFPLKDDRAWGASHCVIVGSAIVYRFEREECDIIIATRAESDLCIQADAQCFVAYASPKAIFTSAVKVGGICWSHAQ